MRRRWSDYHDFYPPSKPIEVEGGIKARGGKGGRGGLGGAEWWSKRWIKTLESFDLGARLSRGRSYARKGQVLDIQTSAGKATAAVQGSRSRPYKVSLTMGTLTESEWERVVEALRGRAAFLAKLLGGEMPPDIEDAFADAQVSLFPGRSKDLVTDCSCPDWSNPCKHIAAVFYLLGEEFDRDPFLLFALRGMTRDDLLARLAPSDEEAEHEDSNAEIPEPLSAQPRAFWSGAGGVPDRLTASTAMPADAPLLHRAGDLPFWRGERSLVSALAPHYEDASRRALDLLANQAQPQD